MLFCQKIVLLRVCSMCDGGEKNATEVNGLYYDDAGYGGWGNEEGVPGLQLKTGRH